MSHRLHITPGRINILWVMCGSSLVYSGSRPRDMSTRISHQQRSRVGLCRGRGGNSILRGRDPSCPGVCTAPPQPGRQPFLQQRARGPPCPIWMDGLFLPWFTWFWSLVMTRIEASRYRDHPWSAEERSLRTEEKTRDQNQQRTPE